MDYQGIFQKFKMFVDSTSSWFEGHIVDSVINLLKAIGILFIDVLRFIADLVQSLLG